MKKRILLVSAVLAGALSASAQLNVQLHYDLGHAMYGGAISSRPKLTATVENFTADRWGNTFFFIDADLADNRMFGAYAEIAREFQFWKAPVTVHIEYDGGLNAFGSYSDAYLAGPAYNWSSSDYTKTASLQLLYKYMTHSAQPHSWQITGTWSLTFARGLCTFSGFADLWHDNLARNGLIFMSEPQFWFNLSPLPRVADDCRFSIGTELELSQNFVFTDNGAGDRFFALPTIAVKWVF